MIHGRVKFLEPQLADLSNRAEAMWTNATPGSNADAGELLSLAANTYWEGSTGDDVIRVDFPTVNVDTIMIVGTSASAVSIEFGTHSFQHGTDLLNNFINSNSIPKANTGQDFIYFKLENPISVGHLIVTFTGPGIKRAESLIVSREIDTLSGYPEIKRFAFSQNEQRTRAKDGRYYINKQDRRLKDLRLRFKNYVKDSDQRLISGLFDRNAPFLVWPSGGYTDFRYSIDGFRLSDIYKMQTMGDFRTGLSYGSYNGLMQFDVRMVESV